MSYNHVIRSDDPNALEKLSEKLAECEKSQQYMKSLNSYYRKHGTCKGCPDLKPETAEKLDAKIGQAYSWDKQPFPSYALTNNNAEINRLKKRIAELERDKSVGFVGWEFPGGEVIVNDDICRLQIVFEDKPDEPMRNELKHNGFKWAPSEGAWQRQLNSNAVSAAARLDFLRPESGVDPRKLQPNAPPKDAPER